MKYRKYILVCLLCVYAGILPVCAELPSEIRNALEKGDAKTLSKYFNSSLELGFSQTQGVYGKAQAEQMLKNFFDNNGPISSYRDMHEINKGNTQVYIGQLYTSKGNYRVYIYMIAVDLSYYIHLMKIENND